MAVDARPDGRSVSDRRLGLISLSGPGAVVQIDRLDVAVTLAARQRRQLDEKVPLFDGRKLGPVELIGLKLGGVREVGWERLYLRSSFGYDGV